MYRLNRRDFARSALATIAYGIGKPAIAQPVPQPISPENVLWSANHEKGDLLEWSQSARGVSSGGNYSDSARNNQNLEVTVTGEKPHSGMFSVYTKLKRAVKQTIGIRLLRWRDNQGELFPDEAYYSAWMCVKHNYRTIGGWWNVCQFKSQRPDGSTSDPTLTGNLQGNGSGYTFYLYDHVKKVSYSSPAKFQAGEWVHIESWMRYDVTQGAVTCWLNGQEVIKQTGLSTKFKADDRFNVWGIGNYTNDIAGHPDGPGIAEVYFDDAMVSTVRRGIT